ncbi:MAG: sigma-70 family RNA polymerase sigma factor [Phycisphaerae bacterium]|nr:sigma-70 family RNA polymerase sigma factor [Phycisphaerae bacterium]
MPERFDEPGRGTGSDGGAKAPEEDGWWPAAADDMLTPLYRYVRWRVPEGIVDDLVQETFASASGRLAQFDPKRGTVWQWVLGIARNKIAQHFRDTGRRATGGCTVDVPLSEALDWLAAGDAQVQRAMTSESPLPEEICHRREFRCLARAALSELEPRHRECLVGRYYEDLSLDELAQRLSISSSAVNSLLYRARRELREAFLSLMNQATQPKENRR